MSNIEKLARDLRFLINIALLAIFVTSVASWFGYGTDDSDASAWNRSGLKLHTDHLTGCQYFQAPNGGLTPRLDENGKQMCKKGTRHDPAYFNDGKAGARS